MSTVKKTNFKSQLFFLFLTLTIWQFASEAVANTFVINSQQQFDAAQNNASAGDSIIWQTGTYLDIFMDISKNGLFISSEKLGKTIFKGVSRIELTASNTTLQGMQFIDGDIGTRDVINIRGSNNLITQINIRAYTCYKYLRIRESSQYVDVTYCNFENRLNLDDQNILSILVNANQPGYHRVQYCSFKNFAGTGNDLGIEPIRIGVSTQADFVSRSLVEYCYFTQCNGDGELISSKARQNVYRYNTFENNPKAELVLRHGSENIVYGNFFLNGKGGVRVREGQNHYIYNNYFYQLDDRAIYLQNESSDPLANIHIGFNTIVSCAELRLGGDGNNKPINVTLSNNIFANPIDDLFENQTGTETWISNIVFGSLGIPLPSTGVTVVDPQLEVNSGEYFGLSASSPAIDAAQSGYNFLPQFTGISNIDNGILFDLMEQNRPAKIEDRDLGCNEFPHNTFISPIATEENTGPSYNSSTLSGVAENAAWVTDLIHVFPNPASTTVNINIKEQVATDVLIKLLNMDGKIVDTVFFKANFSGDKTINYELNNLAAGMYSLAATSSNNQGRVERIQSVRLIKQ